MIARFYRVIHLLSIDVVVGAVVLLHFFSSFYQVKTHWAVYLLLAISVWCIYTYDHLKDSKKAKAPLRLRYHFHLRNENTLRALVYVLLFTGILLVFYLDFQLLLWGLILTILSLFYLFLQFRLSLHGIKEVYVSLIYTSGILLAPFLERQKFDPIVFFSLMVLSLSNLFIFSYIDYKEDKKDQFFSVATIWGPMLLKKYLMILLSLGLAISLLASETNGRLVYFLVAFLIYTVIVIRIDRINQKSTIRILCDGVFLIPILFLL